MRHRDSRTPHVIGCLLALATLGVVLAAHASPGAASMVLRLEVDGPPPPARGRYVIQPRACGGSAPSGAARSVPVAFDPGHSPMRAIRVPPGCYDVRFESLDRHGAPIAACELGAAAGVAVRGDMPTTVVFVGHCQAPLPPLVT